MSESLQDFLIRNGQLKTVLNDNTNKERTVTFVTGLVYGSGFALGAILVATAMHQLFHIGVC